jgi:hypothetical protein
MIGLLLLYLLWLSLDPETGVANEGPGWRHTVAGEDHGKLMQHMCSPLRATDERLFHYPLVYIMEPGHMELSDEEAAALREYLMRGGFLFLDDTARVQNHRPATLTFDLSQLF